MKEKNPDTGGDQMMKTASLAITAVLVSTLIFANTNGVFAEKSLPSNLERTLEAIDKKKTEAASKIMKALDEYKQTLENPKLNNKSTEKRVVDKTQSIHNSITEISNLFQGTLNTTESEPSITQPTVKVINVHKMGKPSPFGPESARIIYKITAGDSPVNNLTVLIQSPLDKIEKTIQSLSPNKSTVHTVFMKVTDLQSVDVILKEI